jgi:hypothetical protein
MWARRTCRSSVSPKKSVVVLVVPDPVPDDPCTIQDANRSMVTGYAHGIDWSRLAHALELETRVSGVEGEGSVGLPRLVLNFRRELAKEFPESGVRA